jgi:hypothetical protein
MRHEIERRLRSTLPTISEEALQTAVNSMAALIEEQRAAKLAEVLTAVQRRIRTHDEQPHSEYLTGKYNAFADVVSIIRSLNPLDQAHT